MRIINDIKLIDLKTKVVMKSFDCVVIGGGMVGAASALSLAQLGLTVAVVEQRQPSQYLPKQAFDLRISAVSLASEQLLSQLGAWQQIKAWRLCPYQRLGVWEHALSYTEFDAKNIKQSHLGHIIENRLLQLSLWQEIEKHSNIKMYCPNTLQEINYHDDFVELMLNNETITSKLVIAADGANSKVRQLVGIGVTGWDYQQSAMLINVETKSAQDDITWQQFFETGPVAMLPLPGKSELGGYASLVWYHHRDEIKRLASLSNTQLQQEIAFSFPKRLGEVKVIDKGAFPLTRRHANQYHKSRVLLLGDAAHSINPMAGQGVNLGFKDVSALTKVIASAIANGECWHKQQVLMRYEKLRRKDNLLMMTAMDALYGTFSHPSPFIKAMRNAGLVFANKVPYLKNKALAYACGI
ncbi:MAG: FAD-dependent oxidoreductase [Colwellia sp.]|nr:FAD-dependent oxidoreductase [Colwellia sp.]